MSDPTKPSELSDDELASELERLGDKSRKLHDEGREIESKWRELEDERDKREERKRRKAARDAKRNAKPNPLDDLSTDQLIEKAEKFCEEGSGATKSEIEALIKRVAVRKAKIARTLDRLKRVRADAPALRLIAGGKR